MPAEMTEPEFESAMNRLATLPSLVARLAVNGAPDDLCQRAERVLQLAIKVLDDVGVLTEMDAIDGLVREWSSQRKTYWAVRPIWISDNIRIERAETAIEAANLAFGRRDIRRAKPAFEAKNLGTRAAIIQSDKKRNALLTDQDGWEPIHGY